MDNKYRWSGTPDWHFSITIGFINVKFGAEIQLSHRYSTLLPSSWGMLGLGLRPATCYEVVRLVHKLPAPMSGFTVPYFAGQTNELLLRPPYFTVAKANCYKLVVRNFLVSPKRILHMFSISSVLVERLPCQNCQGSCLGLESCYLSFDTQLPTQYFFFIHQLLQIF